MSETCETINYERNYEMFSAEANRAVAAALAPRLALLAERNAEGFIPTPELLNKLTREVQHEVRALGHDEVGDTAVREAVYYALSQVA